MLRLLCAALLALCLTLSFALAQEASPPLPDDPVDQRMQQLAVLSQQDVRIAALPYNNGTVGARGCGPVSVSNALIAVFGLTDADEAAQLTYEVMAVLTPKRQYRRSPIDIGRMARVLHQADRAKSVEDFPLLASFVGHFPGQILYQDRDMTAESLLGTLLQADDSPRLLAERMTVQDSWLEAVRIAYALDEAGFSNALICLAHAGAGTGSTSAPLRTSSQGHYLSMCMHVGTFVREGRMYVLDSLPRALAGESFGADSVFHVPYPFAQDSPLSPFCSTFAAARISPTVIRLSLQPDALAALSQAQRACGDAQSPAVLHAELLAPLKLFGRCSMLVSLPERPN